MFAASYELVCDLTCWDEHYPCGVMLYKLEYDSKILIRAEYADSIKEYKMFINDLNIDKSRTKLTFSIDYNDIDDSNIIDVIREITECFKGEKLDEDKR